MDVRLHVFEGLLARRELGGVCWKNRAAEEATRIVCEILEEESLQRAGRDLDSRFHSLNEQLLHMGDEYGW